MKKYMGFLVSLLFVTTLNGQWKFVNPLPFSYDMYTSVFLSESTGWIAGQDGRIFKTTDAGTSWMQQGPGLPESHHLKSIYFVNKDTGWAAGIQGHILKTTNGGDSWIEQTSPSISWIYSINFPTASTGYALGDNALLLKTTNGGDNWMRLPSTSAVIYSAKFFDENKGMAAGYTFNYNLSPAVLFTEDGGYTWSTIIVDSNASGNALKSFCFSDSLTVWAAASPGSIYKSTNRGNKWGKAAIGNDTLYKHFTSINFKDKNNGFITSEYDSAIYVTHDGGLQWKKIKLPVICTLTSVSFAGSKVYASGLGGILFYSTNNGDNWISLNKNISSNNLVRVSAKDSKHVWALGRDGDILKSTDDGVTWLLQNSNTNTNFLTMQFVDTLEGFCGGIASTFIKTTDGGEHWNPIQIDSSGIQIQSIFMLDAQNGFFGGIHKNNSIFFSTSDGGNTWQFTSRIPGEYYVTHIYFKDRLNGWAGANFLNKTTDGGLTWTNTNTVNNGIYKIQFLDSLNGYVLSYGAIFRTSDGGSNWQSSRYYAYVGNSLWFTSANEGWMAGAYGSIYHSTDRGYKWDLQFMGTPHLNDIAFTGTTGIAVGDGGLILRTTNGGTVFAGEDYPANEFSFNLKQNYPNPFNPVTTISYSVAKASQVTLKVYDLLGREIKTLVNNFIYPGNYKIEFNGSSLASGIYFYVLQANGSMQTKKFVLLK